MMPLAARVTHRFGTRNALRGLLALWTLALILPSLAPGLLALCAALFIYGGTAGVGGGGGEAPGGGVRDPAEKRENFRLDRVWGGGGGAGAAGGGPPGPAEGKPHAP